MKTPLPLMLIATAVCVIAMRAQDTALSAKNVLFLAADLNITYQGGLYHVNQVDRGYFVIDVGGRTVRVEADARAGIGIKMKRQLRIAPFSARIDGWVAERAYALGSNPEMVAAVEFGEQRDIEDMLEQRAIDVSAIDNAGGDPIRIDGTPSGYAPMDFVARAGSLAPPPPMTPARAQAISQANFNQGRDPVTMANVANGAHSGLVLSKDLASRNAAGGRGPDPYDAIRVTFRVSSPRPLLQPYVVLVGVFHERQKPKAKHVWVGARDLDSIDERPQTFHLLQDGFPEGFELEKVVLHLYDTGGREVATNLSDQRMEMNCEDTFSYLLMDYFSHHKGDTLPATVATTAVPADWRSRMRSAEYTRNYYVKVDKVGHAQGLYQDTDCTQPVDDAYLKGVVLNIRFRPALQRGKPVSGVARILPANLVQ